MVVYTAVGRVTSHLRSGCQSKMQKFISCSVRPMTLVIIIAVFAIALCYLILISSMKTCASVVEVQTNNNSQFLCYSNLVFNGDNEQYRLKDILADDVLERSNGKNIFFHLTDCILDGVITIDSRQACAVESAARANSHLNVFLAYAAPVGFLNKTRLPLIDALMPYSNIHIRNLNVIKYASTTPVEKWVYEGKLLTSVYIKEHVSDFLRLISLYRFGGQFLDLDTVSIKNISLLGRNFAAAESPNYVANAVMNMDKNTEIGHKVAEDALISFKTGYDPTRWGHNGPVLMTNLLKKLCNATTTSQMTRERCHDFAVFDRSEFYGVSYGIAGWAFLNATVALNKILEVAFNSTLVHMSNSATHNIPVEVDTAVGYGVLAEIFCPKVYHSCGKIF